MDGRPTGTWVSRIRRFVARPAVALCELCSAPLAPQHRHLVELRDNRFLCACDACATALAPSDRFRAIEPRTELLRDFKLTDAEWDDMRIPIDIVFFFVSTPEGRPVAIYPGPAGPMDSALSRPAWTRLVAQNPVLATLSPDVEALLVNRSQGLREYFRVSIDRCYSLVGLMRTQWRGLSGGTEVWDAIRAYFESLRSGTDFPAGRLLHG